MTIIFRGIRLNMTVYKGHTAIIHHNAAGGLTAVATNSTRTEWDILDNHGPAIGHIRAETFAEVQTYLDTHAPVIAYDPEWLACVGE